MSQPPQTLTDYVLGSLPPGEVHALETHLETCSSCRRTVYNLRETFYALPEALPQHEVPVDAWASLQARRQTQPQLPAQPQKKRGGAAYRNYRPAERWALVAVLLLLVGSLGWGLNQQQALGRHRGRAAGLDRLDEPS